ncbi:MAG: hypothetical protein LKE33_02985 [Acidaminococcus sp.]|jgi:hypothetical protein|nr:hypothetical protein [Acidaminococcus sp.]MCI2100741.1 hypothetical protein [Acidaminococcus sp.]MCI2115062.1 hypothetical protein [Acidaminococcus sp.]MCI2117138.1 hypothetical protein [Acidaminococcus sp.]
MINRKMIAKGMTAVSLFTAFMTVVPGVVSAQSTMEKRPKQISADQMKQQPGMNRQQGKIEKNRDSQSKPEMQQGKQNPQVKKNDQKQEMRQNGQKPEMKPNDKKDGRNTMPDRKPSSDNKNGNVKMNQNNRPMPQGQKDQGQGQMPAPESMPRR